MTYRALMRVGFYSLTPMILFAVIVPPSLEPVFTLNVAALRALQRFCSQPQNQVFLLQNLQTASLTQNGPLKRAQQFHADPLFTAALQTILTCESTDRSWEHQLRTLWRSHHWNIIVRARPVFDGVQNLDRKLETELLNIWRMQSDELQFLLNHGLAGPHLQHDPRPRSKILIYILTGGLTSPSRNGRHRYQHMSVQCTTCGVANEVEHIHWYCRKYSALRVQLWLRRIMQAPACFRYAAFPTRDMNLSKHQILKIQETLVNIWQKHITDWRDGDGEVDDWNPDDAPNSPNWSPRARLH